MRSKYFQVDVEKLLRQGQFRIRITAFELDEDGLIDSPALIFVGEWEPKLKGANEWHKNGSHVCESFFETAEEATHFINSIKREIERLDEVKRLKLEELELIPT